MVNVSTQRCFLAWVPDPATRDALAEVQGALRVDRPDRGHRWVDVDKLHLTLRFLGDTTDAQRDALALSLQRLAATHARCACAIAGWQYWPDVRKPHVLVLQIASRGALEALGEANEAAAREAGFERERRPFRAHLTLARIGPLRERPAPLEGAPPPIAFSIDHVALIQSTLQSSGSNYRELARWPLNGSSIRSGPLTFDTGPVSA